MGRLRVWFLVLVVAVVATATSAAALSSVSLDRSVTSGSVLADNNDNVAVNFEALNNSTVFVIDQDTGEVSFDLTNDITGTGFNTNAQFAIGSSSAPVFSITNNANVEVTVNFTENSPISLQVASGTTTLAAGSTSTFYFTIDTTNVDAGTELLATISVSSAE